PVKIRLAAEAFEDIMRKDTMSQVIVLNTDLVGAACREDHSPPPFGKARPERIGHEGPSRASAKRPPTGRATKARIRQEYDALRSQTLKDDLDLTHRHARGVQIVWLRIIGDQILFEPVFIRTRRVSLGDAMARKIDNHGILRTDFPLQVGP